MTRYEQAVLLAVRAHADQVRKSDGSPYIVHPLMVAQLLTEHQVHEEVILAALLHDTLEDTMVTRDELIMAVGAPVVALVEVVTEDKTLPWEERKAAYVRQVVAGGEPVWLLSVADKIHNAESLLDHVKNVGDDAWLVFNRGKETKLWFETLLHTELSKVWHHPLLERYGKLIESLRTA